MSNNNDDNDNYNRREYMRNYYDNINRRKEYMSRYNINDNINDNDSDGGFGDIPIMFAGLFIIFILVQCSAIIDGEGEENEDSENKVENVEESKDSGSSDSSEESSESNDSLTEDSVSEESTDEELKENEETIETPVEEETEGTPVEDAPVDENTEVENTNSVGVTLSRVVDGDTVKVYLNGEEIGLRLLLIDTPETVHPNKPVEPFGKEASNRVKELVTNADLTIEYDSGNKVDHYDRHLVYLYANGVSVQGTLLKEGLARVGYIYEQQKYLNEYRGYESTAKQNNLGIWSIEGYVNTSGEGFNSEDNEDSGSDSVSGEGDKSSGGYSNCTELREDYPDGVDSSHPAYDSGKDRDGDGYACE